MRILHLIASLDPAHGGPSAVAPRLAAAQAALGHRVTIATHRYDDGGDDRGAGDVPGIAAVTTQYVYKLPVGWPVVNAAGRQVQSLVADAGVLHLHGVWEPILLTAAAFARRAKVPYAVRPAGMLDPWSLEQRRWKKRAALLLGVRRMLDGAAFLHALNAHEADLVRPLRLRCPVEVIPNGVWPDELDPPPPAGAFRAAHPSLGGRPFVLFLGRLHFKKGLDVLADAFALLAARSPDVALIVAGPDDGARGDFERRVREARLTDRVHVVGPLYGPAKLAAFADAAAFCLPSRQEGFSVAVTEAMGCGLPVVISEACHFPEVAEAGAGLVTPLDATAVADALGRLLADDALRARMGAAGRAMVLARYTWPRVAGATVAAYARHGAAAAS